MNRLVNYTHTLTYPSQSSSHWSMSKRKSSKNSECTLIPEVRQRPQCETPVSQISRSLGSVQSWEIRSIVTRSKNGNCCLFYSIFLGLDLREKIAFSSGDFAEPEKAFKSFMLRERNKNGNKGYTADDIGHYLEHLKTQKFIQSYSWTRIDNSKVRYPHYLFPVDPKEEKRSHLVVLFGKSTASDSYSHLQSILKKDVTDRLAVVNYGILARKIRSLRRNRTRKRKYKHLLIPKKPKKLADRVAVEQSVVVRNFHLEALLKMKCQGHNHASAVKFRPYPELPFVCDNKYMGDTPTLTYSKIGQSMNNVSEMYQFHLEVGV
jgi:hypothetical protein